MSRPAPILSLSGQTHPPAPLSIRGSACMALQADVGKTAASTSPAWNTPCPRHPRPTAMRDGRLSTENHGLLQRSRDFAWACLEDDDFLKFYSGILMRNQPDFQGNRTFAHDQLHIYQRLAIAIFVILPPANFRRSRMVGLAGQTRPVERRATGVLPDFCRRPRPVTKRQSMCFPPRRVA